MASPEPRAPTQRDPSAEPAALEREAAILARYLLGVDPPAVLVERYLDANAMLALEPPTDADRPAIELARAHPWTLRYLDAGHALLHRESQLRKKILLMLALLETTPELASRFEAPATSRRRAVATLLGNGVAVAFHAVVGVMLTALFVRRPR